MDLIPRKGHPMTRVPAELSLTIRRVRRLSALLAPRNHVVELSSEGARSDCRAGNPR